MAASSTLPSKVHFETVPCETAPSGRAIRVLHLWHLTSLDAPTVAVVWCLAFAWTAQVRLPIWLPLVLALSAWSFYVADRLLDAYRGIDVSPASLRPRHYFHSRHRRILIPAAAGATLAAIALVLHAMSPAARIHNSVLAAAAMVYFTTVHSPWRISTKLRFPKELLVGVLFTVACAMPSLARAFAHAGTLAAPMLAYIALAWLNCHAIELWESNRPGDASVLWQALILAATAFVSAVVSAAIHLSRPAVMLAAAAVGGILLALLDRGRHRLGPTTLRAAADLALLTPAILLLPL